MSDRLFHLYQKTTRNRTWCPNWRDFDLMISKDSALFLKTGQRQSVPLRQLMLETRSGRLHVFDAYNAIDSSYSSNSTSLLQIPYTSSTKTSQFSLSLETSRYMIFAFSDPELKLLHVALKYAAQKYHLHHMCAEDLGGTKHD
jgi:hypothetical protein